MTRSELLAVAKPILFNTEMVTAITDNRKIATRRLINPRYRKDEGGFQVCTNMATGERWVEKVDENECGIFSDGTERRVYPRYQPGDILYVRETWANYDRYYYKATEPDAAEPIENSDSRWFKWHPSIHMSKEAARLFLRVTDVRVEQLQNITAEQCKKEGMTERQKNILDKEEYWYWFKELWDSTIPKHPNKFKSYPFYWKDNPWVWVIEFERIKPV